MVQFFVVGLGGLIGGLINEFLRHGGLKLPGTRPLPGTPESKIWDPGFVGSLFVGLAGAIVTWGLYGAPPIPPGVAWKYATHLAGGILSGTMGSRLFTKEVVDDKILARSYLPPPPG